MRNFNIYREDGFGVRPLLRWAIAGLATACFAVSASAVDPTRSVSQYLHDTWGTERGWPGGYITAIAQTPDGYLWIGTDRGLIRFDGLNFQQFEQAHPDPIWIGPVRTLLVDSSGDLWILLYNTIVFRYHNGNFELARGWPENGTTAMARGTSGGVLLSSLAEGTITYSDNRFRTLSSAALLAGAAGVANSEAPDRPATSFSWFDRLAAPVAISMAQTDDGKIWLGTERRGLFYLQEGRVLSASNGRDDTKINCLLPLPNSELWVGTAKGVQRWNGTELTLAGVPSSLLNLEVLSILRDRDSNIWVGTSRGLFRYNANGLSLASNHEIDGPATALFEDREGEIWIGSARGLERLRDSTFITYSLPNLKSQSMGPLHVDSSRRTWTAPIQGGLRWMKEGKSGIVTADGIAKDVVYSIASTGNDDVWVGRQQGGLTHLRYSGNSFTAQTYTQADGLAQNSVYAVYRSRDGTVWSGTLSSGVSALKNGHFTNYTTADGLAANTISSIAEGLDGTVWFGTPNGLSALTKHGWRTYKVGEGLASQDVNCLLQDSSDVLWIGTAEGLAFFSAGHVKVPQVVPDSLHEAILGLAEDGNGGLWVATANHVLQVKRAGLMGNALSETDVREYGLADGLLSTEGVKRSQSVVVDSQGRVWFSTNHGLSVVNPTRTAASSAPTLVHIEGVAGDGTALDLGGPIRFPPGTRRMTFRYVGLSLSNSERVRYRYRLDNIDRGWSEGGTSQEATYNTLSVGTYRFRVMASNSDGLWNSSEATIGFAVEPALWQTWWFQLDCVICAGLATLLVYRLRIRRLTQLLKVSFEERLAERTRIARDLHDTLLQSFHGSMLRFQAASNLLATRPSDAKLTLDSAIDEAAQAITQGRDAIEGLRTPVVERNDLALAIRALGEEVAASENNQKAAAFQVDVAGTPRNLQPIPGDEVYRITAEALRNALRHAEARRIEVEIRYDDQELLLRVRDDGKGIDPNVLQKGGQAGHYGLRGISERARLVGGQLNIWSNVDAGTELELSLPASIAYAESPARLRSWLSQVWTKS